MARQSFITFGDLLGESFNLNDLDTYVFERGTLQGQRVVIDDIPRFQITGTILIPGSVTNQREHRYRTLQLALEGAPQSSAPGGHGERVTFAFQSDLVMQFWDIRSGTLTKPVNALGRMLAGITLICNELGRGIPQTFTADDLGISLPIVNGSTDAVIEVSGIHGDAPALVEFALTDDSTSGVVINRVTATVRSDRDLTVADFTAVKAITVGADATETDGIATLTTDTTWQELGYVTGTERALVDLVALINDTSTIGNGGVVDWGANGGLTPTNGGSLTADAIRVVIVVLDASSVMAISEPLTAMVNGLSTSNALRANWNPVSGGTDTRVYFKKGTDAWRYQTTTGVASVYTITADTGTVDDPPTDVSNTVKNALFRVVFSIDGSATAYAQPYVPSRIAGGHWEALSLFSGIIPPRARMEHHVDPVWRATIQVRAANSDSSPDVSLGNVFVLPTADHSDASRMVATYYRQDLTTPWRWILDTYRDGYASGYLDNGSGTVVDQVDVLGGLTLMPEPYNNLLIILCEIAGGVSNVTDCAFSVALTVTPRFRNLGAGTP